VANLPISVLLLTRNEEANIAACLESVRWAGEVFVVDSLSTDRSVEIARDMGAKVYLHPFEGYAIQRNWALDNLPFRHEWVLVIDADERIPAPLREEIRSVLQNPDGAADGYYLKRRLFFWGRWLRHGGIYPTWILRLFRRRAGRFEDRLMNEHVVLQGRAGYLREPFDHRDARPLRQWIAKHNRYAELEAEEYLRGKCGELNGDSLAVRFWGRQAERKRWMKFHIWNRLPLLFRPFLFFFRNYFLKGGFLDGQPGLVYHLLWSFWYPLLISAKILERQKAAEGAAVRGAVSFDRGRGEAAGIAGAASSAAPTKAVCSTLPEQ
jgi:glycosyltransferase involved in cell wall biosynthesis